MRIVKWAVSSNAVLFGRLSLRQRLALGMAAIVLPLLLISLIGYRLFQYAVDVLEQSHEEISEEVIPMLQLQETILLAQMPANDYLILGDAAERGKFEKLEAAVNAGFDKVSLAAFDILEKRSYVEKARTFWQQGAQLSRDILALPEPLGDHEAAEKMVRMDEVMQRASEQLRFVSVLASAELQRQHETVHRLDARLRASMVFFMATVSVVIGIGFLLIRNWIVAPLDALRNGAVRFGAGDLAYRIPVGADDEIGRVADTLNGMANDLARDREALHNLAIHDPLTGLVNMKEFQRGLDVEFSRAERYHQQIAVMMIDIDYFKRINDRFGHPIGDVVLREVADRIRESIRPTDVVARYGGEEFVVMLPETGRDGAVSMGERLCAGMRAAPIRAAADIQPRVTVSVGVAVFPLDAEAPMSLIQVADQALYRAKQSGRDRCCVAWETVDPETAP